MRNTAAVRGGLNPLDLQTQLDQLTARVTALEAERGPARDARLLTSIAAGLGSAVFTAADLVRHAAHDPELAAALGSVGARRLGNWLRRLHGRAVGPYLLTRVKRDAAGALWVVHVRENIHGGAGIVRASGAR